MDKPKEKPRPFPLIIQRWLDLLVLSIISALIFVILHPVIAKLSGKLAEWVSQSNVHSSFSVPLFVLLFLLTTFLWFFLIRLGGFRYHNLSPNRVLRSSLKASLYPATWPFAFFGVFLYYWMTALICNTVRFDWSIIGLSIVSFIPGIIFASFLDYLFSLSKPTLIQPVHTSSIEKPIKNFRALLQNQSASIDWLNNETPIQSSEEDLFDLAIFAKRIGMMLRATPLKTIAVVGAYGCGKSSIINMIEEYLETPESFHGNQNATADKNFINTENIIHCKVHGWGLQKNAAVEHILQTILSELAKSVDCLGLARIPNDYRVAFSNTGSSWLKTFALLPHTTRKPIEILRKLDNVLACTNKRMIIFLEDLDRNTTGLTYWKELSSLLDRLKDLDSISFVLAVNQTSATYDILTRVCEHVEFIPVMQEIEVFKCVKHFRDICLKKYERTDVDYQTRKERDEHIGLKENSQEYQIAAMLGIKANNPINIIAKLLANPRIFKLTLRHVLHTWNSLHGEIDYDDLLVARVIYIVTPEAFAFMNEHQSLLRYFKVESTADHIRKKQEENRKELDAVWQSLKGSWDRELVKILINFLFPGWIEENPYKETALQGVFHSEPSDYWIRLNREELTKDEIPDQVILHGLHKWKKDHDQSVYQNLNLPEAIFQINGFAGKIEHFGHLLDGHEIRSLAGELFVLIRKDGYKIPNDANYYGFLELWRLSLNNPVGKHDEWILDEIKKAVSVSLRFANDLYYYWRNQDHSSVQTDTPTPALRKGFIEAARNVYEKNKKALIAALDPAYMDSIQHFMIYFSELKSGGPGFNPDEWKWLIDVLIEAGKEDPQVIISQLVTVISNETPRFREGSSYSLDEKMLDSVFGEDKSTILKLLATKIDTSMFNEREKDRIDYVRKEAAGRVSK